MSSRKEHSVGRIIGGTFANIGRVIAALIMVGIITGCIIACVLTVYILRYVNSDDQVSLDNIDMRYTTILYTEETDPETGVKWSFSGSRPREPYMGRLRSNSPPYD